MIKLHKKYKPLFESDDRTFIISGGRGSSKSFSVGAFICLLSFEPGHRILYTRQTMTSAHLSIIPEIQEKLSLLGVEDKFTVNRTEIINNESKSEIIFKGITSSSGSNTANLKSLSGITTWIVDECEELDKESVYDKINLSIRTKGKQNRVILILNPTTREFWLYKKFFQDAGVQPGWNGSKNGVTYIHTDYRDNSDNLDQSFLLEVERIKEINPKKYEHQILGGWLDKAEGVIFTNWEIGEFDNTLPVVYGADFGWSIDPTTLTRCAVDKNKGIIYMEELVYKIGMTTNDIYESFLRHAGFDGSITADSAEPRLISELKAKGLNIKPCEKGPGSVTAGIAAMQDFKIVITPESTNIAKELNHYVWSDKRAGVPVDAFQHSLDSARYACFPLIKSPKPTRAVYVG